MNRKFHTILHCVIRRFCNDQWLPEHPFRHLGPGCLFATRPRTGCPIAASRSLSLRFVLCSEISTTGFQRISVKPDLHEWNRIKQKQIPELFAWLTWRCNSEARWTIVLVACQKKSPLVMLRYPGYPSYWMSKKKNFFAFSAVSTYNGNSF